MKKEQLITGNSENLDKTLLVEDATIDVKLEEYLSITTDKSFGIIPESKLQVKPSSFNLIEG